MLNIKKQGVKGFTLIELLVVIAIIGILASVVLASLNSARRKSRDARRIADVKQLQLALELYYDSNDRAYPTDVQGLAILDDAASCGTGVVCIPSVPTDPTGGNYSYHRCASDAQIYHLGGTLEESTNPALDNDLDATPCGAGEAGDFSAADPVYSIRP